jgi:hypothetical protein
MKQGLIRLTVLASACAGALSVNAASLAECTTIADDVARLACFDTLSLPTESPPVMETPDTLLVDTAVQAETSETSEGNDSRLATRLKQEESNDGNRWSITPHKRRKTGGRFTTLTNPHLFGRPTISRKLSLQWRMTGRFLALPIHFTA